MFVLLGISWNGYVYLKIICCLCVYFQISKGFKNERGFIFKTIYLRRRAILQTSLGFGNKAPSKDSYQGDEKVENAICQRENSWVLPALPPKYQSSSQCEIFSEPNAQLDRTCRNYGVNHVPSPFSLFSIKGLKLSNTDSNIATDN